MKMIYKTPEINIIEFDKLDVILTSPTEGPIPETIVGGGSGGDLEGGL